MTRNNPAISSVGSLLDQIQSLSRSEQVTLFHKLSVGADYHIADDALVNESVAADELGLSPITLSIWRSTGRYSLPYVKIGRLVKYQMSDLREFKNSGRVDTRSTIGA